MKRDHRPRVHGDQVNKVQCKVEISPQVTLCGLSFLHSLSHLIVRGNLFHEECVVAMVLLGPLSASRQLPYPPPQKSMSFSPWSRQRFLSCSTSGLSLTLSEPLYYGHMPIRPQVPRLITNSAHKGTFCPRPGSLRTPVVCSDAGSRSCGPQSRLRGSVRSSRQMGQVTSPVGSPQFLKPWELLKLVTCPDFWGSLSQRSLCVGRLKGDHVREWKCKIPVVNKSRRPRPDYWGTKMNYWRYMIKLGDLAKRMFMIL